MRAPTHYTVHTHYPGLSWPHLVALVRGATARLERLDLVHAPLEGLATPLVRRELSAQVRWWQDQCVVGGAGAGWGPGEVRQGHGLLARAQRDLASTVPLPLQLRHRLRRTPTELGEPY